MKLSTVAVCVATLAMPLAAFAQQSQSGLTRAEVRAQLVELEKTGWRPAHEGYTYPDKIEAAEAKVAAEHAAAMRVTTSGSNNAPTATGNGS
ncbi:DUF4148 domain-containing protein [Pararobbsia alpina]|uniref:DUF4148 domain-containing protein n=1 Tax=Pararobbsia alpina TaxID=621374 RepID=A0A6S7BC71_9BURK|nr:DUF4148 domain-containing protein [Pararobbsia alpina]CAB3794544.1 hypothetical protein LMG28138_03727 [Pararobbsia alpina]